MHHRLTVRVVATLLTSAVVLTACGRGDGDLEAADSTVAPRIGACRVLTPTDIEDSTNASPTVDCGAEHTAETFATGTFTATQAGEGLDDVKLGAAAYQTCHAEFMEFLGGDESLVMRSVLTWAWFRPSQKAWDKGARWFRCDVVGGGEQSKSFVSLPETAEGLLLGKPDDKWMVCVDGPTVSGSVKGNCADPHIWRAVTTIVLGRPEAPYPGDRVAEVRTRDFCSDSVGAWLNYPVDYEFGYTWFHEAEWKAGNRRSICWAKTEQ